MPYLSYQLLKLITILLKESEHLAFFLIDFHGIKRIEIFFCEGRFFGSHLFSLCNDIESPEYIMFDTFCNTFDVCCDWTLTAARHMAGLWSVRCTTALLYSLNFTVDIVWDDMTLKARIILHNQLVCLPTASSSHHTVLCYTAQIICGHCT